MCAFPSHGTPGSDFGKGAGRLSANRTTGGGTPSFPGCVLRGAPHHYISLQLGEPAPMARLHPVSRHTHLVSVPSSDIAVVGGRPGGCHDCPDPGEVVAGWWMRGTVDWYQRAPRIGSSSRHNYMSSAQLPNFQPYGSGGAMSEIRNSQPAFSRALKVTRRSLLFELMIRQGNG
jgi:hypothetical protein